MQKWFSMLLVCVLCLSMGAYALADEIGQEHTIDGECSFTIEDIQECDTFFNQKSGTAKQFIVMRFRLLNRRTEKFFLKADTSALLVYDGSFELEPDFLCSNPEGNYYASDPGAWMCVFGMTDDGQLIKAETGKQEEVVDQQMQDLLDLVAMASGEYYEEQEYVETYDPIEDIVYSEPNSPHDDKAYKSQDPSKTVLDPLVERTYHYVFLVPDIVAEEEGNREMYFTVNGEEYSYRF